MELITQILGYVGSLLILLSFVCVTRGSWKPQSKRYLLTNFVGALLLAMYQITLDAYAGVLLNIVFAGVALGGLVTYWNAKNKP